MKQEVDQLKSLCEELESQIGVLEMLVEHRNNEIEKYVSIVIILFGKYLYFVVLNNKNVTTVTR